MKKKSGHFFWVVVSFFALICTFSGTYSYFNVEQVTGKDGGGSGSFIAQKTIPYYPEHKITFIIDSSLNNYGTSGKFNFSFNEIEKTSGTAYKVNGKYTFVTKYKESSEKTFGFGFEITGDKFVHNIRNINIPTWDTAGKSVDYKYSTEHFNNLADGGSKGSPSLTVAQDSEGNVIVTIRMVEKNC